MTMKIEVTIPEDDIKAGAAAQYLTRALSAIGFHPAPREYQITVETPTAPAIVDALNGLNGGVVAAVEDEPKAEVPKRERGKPAPGRARRTKEEIAEDEAADAAGATEEPKAAISTGEERIDPTTVEDATQDAADEAAEAETTQASELTHDDVRASLKKYLDAYGTAAAMEDGPKVLKMLFGDTAAKVSDVPSDQESLAKAIAGIDEMCQKNPFSRTVQL